MHTFLSSTRDIFYGFSFLVFEEKLFFDFFRKCFKKSLFEDDSVGNEGEAKPIISSSNTSCACKDYIKANENEEENEDDNKADESINDIIEMNISEYNENENDN